MKRLLSLACAAFAAVSVLADGVAPVSDRWGGAGGDWTSANGLNKYGGYAVRNPRSWLKGVVPGRYTEKAYDTDGTTAITVTNGTFGGEMHFGNKITYAYGTTWAWRTDWGNIVSISNIFYEADDDVSSNYYIYDWNTVNLEAGGGIYVSNTVQKVPYFVKNATLRLVNVTPANCSVHIRNDSAFGALKMGCDGKFERAPGTSGTCVPKYILEGRGDICYQAGISSEENLGGPGTFVLAQSGEGKVIFETTGASYRTRQFIVPESDTVRTIQIADGANFQQRMETYGIDASSDVLVTGLGRMLFRYYETANAGIRVVPGKTVRYEAGMSCYSPSATLSSGEHPGFFVDGGGTLVMSGPGTNLLQGAARAIGGSTLSSATIGTAGQVDSPLGCGDRIRLQTEGRFLYTGSGETTDRSIRLANGIGVFEQAGTGPLTVSGDVIGEANNTTLVLSNATEFEGTLSGGIRTATAGHSMTVVKKGAGEWRIEGAATFKGVVRVDGGLLALTDTASLPEAVVTVGADGGLSLAGEQAIRLVVAGDASVSVAAGAMVTFEIVSRDAGTLDLTVAEGGKVKVRVGGEGGVAPTWVRMNGYDVTVDADGVLVPCGACKVTIDAHGGVVPDDAGAQVSIATAEGPADENVTLAASATSVVRLEQKQTVVDAKLVLGADEALSVGRIEIADGAKDLVVAGPGAIAGEFGLKGDGLVRTNETDGTSVRLASGTGATIALDGDLSEADPLDLTVRDGTVELDSSSELKEVKLGVKPFPVPGMAAELKIGGGLVAHLAADRSFVVEGRVSITNAVLGRDDVTYNAKGIILQGTNSPAVVDVHAGAVVTNFIQMSGVGAENAFRQHGGTVVSKYKTGERCTAMGGGYNYQLLEDGAFTYDSGVVLGQSPSQAIVCQKGGRMVVNCSGGTQFVLGNWDTQAHFIQSGGYLSASSFYMPHWNSGNNHVDSERLMTVLTIEGAGTTNAMTNGSLGLYDRTETENEKANLSAINLNDGATHIIYNIGTYAATANIPASNRIYYNVNGGIIHPSATTPSLFGGKTVALPHVVIYEKGLTFVAANYASGIRYDAVSHSGFDKPTGNGVVSVAVPDAVAARTFAGPPAVVIIGDGEGASAAAIFDDATGKVTGVKVTSHGVDYTWAKARWCYAGLAWRCEDTTGVELAPNSAAGGLTKKGYGTLTITNDVCTYEGPTVIELGTLQCGCDNAFGTKSALVLNGGTFNLGGFSQTFSDITCNGGTVTGGRLTISGLTVDFDAVKAGSVKKVDIDKAFDFAPGAAVSVLNYDASKIGADDKRFTLVDFVNGTPDPMLALPTLDLPEGWVLKMSGNRLMIKRDIGLMLIVR